MDLIGKFKIDEYMITYKDHAAARTALANFTKEYTFENLASTYRRITGDMLYFIDYLKADIELFCYNEDISEQIYWIIFYAVGVDENIYKISIWVNGALNPVLTDVLKVKYNRK